MSRRLLAGLAATGVLLLAAPVASGLKLAPTFRVPFACGQTWSGWTRTNHNPPQAVDFNRPDDVGDVVVASAGGVVGLVDRVHESYGTYIAIDHGDGWETRYAHLATVTVAQGDRVRRGAPIGTVGSTGDSQGPHLHYEQRLDGRPMRIVLSARESPAQGVRSYSTPHC